MALLDGKRVLITGAGRGIGLAAAAAMRNHGARVCVTDIDADAVAAGIAEMGGASDDLLSAVMDIRDEGAIRQTLETIADRWSALDVLVNNAAVVDATPVHAVETDRFREVVDINLTSALVLSQMALPLLRSGRNPAIVNTVSTQAFFGQPGSAAYAAAKGGLMNLTRVMAIDLGAEGIRVNAVAPGFIDTRMAVMPDGTHEHDVPSFKTFYLEMGRIPLKRAGTPEDCAGAFVFLASDLSLYTTGQALFVDGGLSATY
ncbi:SDR family NAD(P)-dependent oxidoreductase [Bauldia sp.]|uniref:SDR family NAD(P)-dependent oxidoreductase n=1 Tax=Bauldia sp. TaxID=2575872 RepID=UPI003BAD2F35